MKIKMDFVTNSSSSCFTVAISPKDLRKFRSFINKLYKDPQKMDSVYIETVLKSEDELKAFTNDEPLDWISKAMGPKFVRIEEENYITCKKALDEGNIVTISWIDYNLTRKFQDRWKDNILIHDN